MIPPPPRLQDLPAGTQLVAGLGFATILPDLDFETRSEAGFIWNDAACCWDALPGAPQGRKGLPVVGAAVYATHPTTEILSLKYDLKDGRGQRHWKPGDPPPLDLFAHIAAGGLLEAHNSGFEHWIWNQVAVLKLGWPPLPLRQLRCSMAKARAFAMPAALDNLGGVLRLKVRKDKDGTRLLKKFSIPRDPTKKDARVWITPQDDPADAERLYQYNGIDIESEAEASSMLPDLVPDELEYWLCDQEINYRGVAVDAQAVADCIAIVEQVFAKYDGELRAITGGLSGSQLQKLQGWLAGRGLYMNSMGQEQVEEALKDVAMDPLAYRVLELRAKVGSASIKKLFTIRNQMSKWNRIHDLINYHAARTGRDGGQDAQTQNLPKAGPAVHGPNEKPDAFKCCGRYFGASIARCPWCGTIWPPGQTQEWTWQCQTDAFAVIATRSLDLVEAYFGDAIELVVGCLRGLFIAADGHDLMASDYSAIEAVVAACIGGEEWRLVAFRERKDIYLASAAQTTSHPYEFYIEYKKANGKQHPHRQQFKIAELALGYGGWVGAMEAFGAGEFMTAEEMRTSVLQWRATSPAIVECWGGQFRSLPWLPDFRAEYFGLEGAAVQAILNPGREFTYKAPHPVSPPITYVMRGDVLFCILPSARPLTYHNPRLVLSTRGPFKGHALAITFMGWNSNPKMGAMGWVQLETYGPKLFENVVQAVSRDIFRDGIVRLCHAGYPVVLRVHDEPVAEVPHGFGTIEEFESLMMVMPPYAQDWPIRATGGWRGRRYRKD